MSLDYLFGSGVSRNLPIDELKFSLSRKTGRLRMISIEDVHVATFRSDGGIALSIYGAQLLFKSHSFKENCVQICDEVIDPVSEGLSVFSKHVVWCGNHIKPGSEVAVIDLQDRVIAVGRAILSTKMIKEFKRGVAVKVRAGIKN